MIVVVCSNCILLIKIIASLSCDTHTQLLQPRKVRTANYTYKKIIKSLIFLIEEDCDSCCTHDKKLEKGNLSKQDEVLLLAFVRTYRWQIPFFPNSSLSIPKHPSSIPNLDKEVYTLPTDSLSSCR